MTQEERVIKVLHQTLNISCPLESDSKILGHLPALDSLSLVRIQVDLEGEFRVPLKAPYLYDHMETVGSLTRYINSLTRV